MMTEPGRERSSPYALLPLAGSMLLASLGISIVSVALPTLAASYSVPISDVQWLVVAYLLSVTVAVVSAGRLGDIYGHRSVLIAGLFIFAAASILCAAAPTLPVLIAGRAAQGMGGAVLMVLPISMVRDIVATDRTGSAMGVLGTVSAIGTALGPVLGGIMIAGFGWRSIFMLLAAVGSVVLVLVVSDTVASNTVLSNNAASPAGRRNMPMGWPGLALLVLGVSAYALAATSGKVATAFPDWLLLSASALVFVAFVIVEARSPAPLVPVSILRHRVIASSLAANLLVGTIMMATLVVGPFFLSLALHLDIVLVGVIMAVGPATAAIAGFPAGHVTDRFGAPRIVLIGLVVIIVGLICLGSLPRLLGAPGYALALVILTPGFQLFLAANNTTVMISATEAQRGMLSGLLGLSRNMGFMTGASVMMTLFAWLAGSTEIAMIPARAIATAFTATFFVSAGIALLALLLVLLGQYLGRDPEKRE